VEREGGTWGGGREGGREDTRENGRGGGEGERGKEMGAFKIHCMWELGRHLLGNGDELLASLVDVDKRADLPEQSDGMGAGSLTHWNKREFLAVGRKC
jgi:hypothetical protein